MTKEAPQKRKNGSAKPPAKRRKPAAPPLPEKTRRLTLKVFQKTYEAHHGKAS
jgi:hypothetical protein